MQNVPNLSELMKDYAYKTGALINQHFEALDSERQQKLDDAVNTLAGVDTQVMAVINKLQAITDAEPGSPEWDEGQNLYTLMTNNYVALDARITATENVTASLQTWKAAFITDYTATIARIDAAVAAEVTARQGEITRVEGLIASNTAMIEASDLARAQLKTQLEQADAAQTDEINALKGRMTTAEAAINEYGANITALQGQMASRVTEITALQTKQTENEARFSVLESKFDGLTMGNAVPEFAAGLNKQPSPGGYAEYTG